MKELDLKRLFELALDQVAELEEGLFAFAQLLRENYKLRQFFEDPTVADKKKKKMFRELMPEASDFLLSLMDLIIEEGMEKSVPKISQQFTQMVMKRLKLNFADVCTAYPLTAHERGFIEKLIGGKVLLRVKVDKSLIAGMKFMTNDGRYFDCTLKGLLEGMKERIAYAG